MKIAIGNFAVICGGACITYGTALIAPAAGWFVGGCLLFVAGIALAIAHAKEKEIKR